MLRDGIELISSSIMGKDLQADGHTQRARAQILFEAAVHLPRKQGRQQECPMPLNLERKG